MKALGEQEGLGIEWSGRSKQRKELLPRHKAAVMPCFPNWKWKELEGDLYGYFNVRNQFPCLVIDR